mgnify:CR=1 FL=1
MDDTISRQAALNCFHDWIDSHGDVHTADEIPEYNEIMELPSAQSEEIIPHMDAISLDKQEILQAGYEGQEYDFYIGGRLFSIKEKAQ